MAQNRADISPWQRAGGAAESELAQLYGLGKLVQTDPLHGGVNIDASNAAGDQAAAFGRFQTSPGYQFRLQQGVNALDRSAAARGMVLSGAQGKALTDYGQGVASNEYGNYIGGLNTMSGRGAQGVTGIAGIDASLTNAGNQDYLTGALKQAQSYSDSANALAAGIKGGVNSLFSLGAYGGSGGTFGFPGLGTRSLSAGLGGGGDINGNAY